MSTNPDTARARLRAADPADRTDPHDASARAMFDRIVAGAPELTAAAEPVRVRTRSPRRRLVLAGAALAAVAATVTAGVVTTPWSHPASAAFAVTLRPDGSIDVNVKWDQLKDPTELNAKLAGLHARTVLVQETDDCQARFAVDRDTGTEWTSFSDDPDRVFTIHPAKIPARDTLLISYWYTGDGHAGGATWKTLLVPKVPSCVRMSGPQARPGGLSEHH